MAWMILLSGCDIFNGPEYQYYIPELADEGWIVGNADELGVNSRDLSEMMDYINETSGHNIHSILIFKDSTLVFEAYFDGYLYSNNPPGSNGDFITYTRETDHYLASVSKSITSVLFGIAVKEGMVENIHDRVVDVMPEYDSILTNDKSAITLEHLLTMTAGLSWDESSSSYEDPSNDVTALFMSEDPIEYILSLPLLDQPGEEFLYNSGATNVLGAYIQKVAGMSLLDFGNQYLFDPLEIDGGLWERLPGGNFFASGGIYLRPRELAKIGYLFLNNGYWEDQQIITKDWIEASVTEHVQTYGRTLHMAHAYGYQWWMQDYTVSRTNYHSFMAAGWGDQYLIVFPEQDLMVVFNGGNFQSSGSISYFELIEAYIIPSIE